MIIFNFRHLCHTEGSVSYHTDIRSPILLCDKVQCMVSVVMAKCVSLLQREYIRSHTGQWSICWLTSNWECSLKMGYYIRGSCILMRWITGLDLGLQPWWHWHWFSVSTWYPDTPSPLDPLPSLYPPSPKAPSPQCIVFVYSFGHYSMSRTT